MGLLKLDFGTNTFTNILSFQAPPLPVGQTIDGDPVIVNQKFLYVPFHDGTLYSYAIDGPTGDLTFFPSNGPYLVNGGDSVASDPAGKFLFVGDASGQTVAAYTINQSDGTLTVVPNSPFATGGVSPLQMTTDGLGNFLYVSGGFGGTQIAGFKIDPTTGALTAVPNSPVSATLSALAGEKSGKFLFGVDGTFVDESITIFNIDQATGALNAPGTSVTTTYAPVNLAVHPNGAFVYTFNEDASSNFDPIEGFGFNSSTGALTPLQSSPFISIKSPQGKFEQSGQYLFAVGEIPASGIITPFAVDTGTGALSSPVDHLAFQFRGGFAVTDAP